MAAAEFFAQAAAAEFLKYLHIFVIFSLT